MVASILIIGFSVILFVYWFRYTCVLILSTRTAHDYGPQVAQANQLRFIEMQERLRPDAQPAAAMALDDIRTALDRDYRLVSYLLRHGSSMDKAAGGLERQMLAIDYVAMKVWFAVTRKLAMPQARTALQEMSDIVAHFANAMGERAAAAEQA